MQAFVLQPHPDTRDTPVKAVSATLSRGRDGALTLRYRIIGGIDGIRVPTARSPAQADGLWAHTCCEAFIGAAGSTAYREFNFSPSGEWAIYDFDDYRLRRDKGPIPLLPPAVIARSEGGELLLEAAIDAAALPAGNLLQLGLSAVIETTEGALSYWALRHPSERPDFHHRDTFTLTLSQASR